MHLYVVLTPRPKKYIEGLGLSEDIYTYDDNIGEILYMKISLAQMPDQHRKKK